MPAHKVYRTCRQCGKSFWRPKCQTVFCSRDCYIASKKRGEERECPICARSFYVPAWDAERRTCSHECGMAWRSLHMTGENANRWLGGAYTFACKGCGVSVKRTRRLPNGRYCSNRCQSDHASRLAAEARPRSTCRVCSKEFDYIASHRPGVTCSNECRKVYQRGRNSPGFRHGRSAVAWGHNWYRQRERARRRDGHACRACGAAGVPLDVHHIIPRALFGDAVGANELANLVTLCKPCHGAAERESRRHYDTGQLWLVA